MTLPLGIHSQKWSKIFWLLFSFTLIAVVAMQITGKPLKTMAAPGGIVSFEFSGSLARSQNILDSWQGEAMTWAGINLGLDFLFLTLYGITIALGCLLMAEKLREPLHLLKQIGKWMAIGMLVAAFLDIIENLSLIALLVGSSNALLPVVARYCAIPKFWLIAISLGYILVGWLPGLRKTSDLKA